MLNYAKKVTDLKNNNNQLDRPIWAHYPNIYAAWAYIRVSIFKLRQTLTHHISYHSLLEALFIFPGRCQGQDKHNSIIFCIQWGMTSLTATAKRQIIEDWKTACLIIMWQAARTHRLKHTNRAGYNCPNYLHSATWWLYLLLISHTCWPWWSMDTFNWHIYFKHDIIMLIMKV